MSDLSAVGPYNWR